MNAIYFLPLMLLNKNRTNTNIIAQEKLLPTMKEFFYMSITFGLTVFAWIFFRAENLGHAWEYINEIFSKSLFTIPYYKGMKTLILLIFVFIIIEWLGRGKKYALEFNENDFPRVIRWGCYYGITILVLFFSGNQTEFIYFQF